MKRFLCLLLAAISLAGFAPGCAKAPTSANARDQFLALVNAGNYAAAYEMLHSSVRYDADQQAKDKQENKQQPSDRISKEQFVQKYQAIFSELQIKGASFVSEKEVEGNAISVYDYTLSYNSPLLDKTPMEFRMTVRRENEHWTVEWSPALMFPEMAWGDTVRVGQEKAQRGEILADGVVYAQTVNAVSVLAVPAKIEDQAQFIRQAALLLNMTTEAVTKKLAKTTGDFTILKQLYPDELTDSLKEQLLLLPGISIDQGNLGTLRDYPQGSSLAHIIGYVGTASADDLIALTGSASGSSLSASSFTGATQSSLYNLDSRVGKSGLEKLYEKQLRGSDGSYVYICGADGTNKKTLYENPAQNGLDVQLTLDPDLQKRAEDLLKVCLFGDDTAGAVVVLNPKTGSIEAMASYPSFDLNLFTRGISQQDWDTLSKQQNAPLYNRLTQGRYPPGSILKPFTASAALESGSMTPGTQFPFSHEAITEDKWVPAKSGEFGPWGYGAITRVQLNHRHSPPLNMTTGMIDSDNIYFAYAALRTGSDTFSTYLDNAGFNEGVPFELGVQAAQLKNKDSVWNPMLLAESAFGQGEVLVTPLQAAVEFSAFANGGSIMAPYLVKGLYKTDGNAYTAVIEHQDTVWKANVVKQSSVNTLLPMLEAVIQQGTGAYLKLDNIAGKTGTAQIGNDRRREINWFVGFRVSGDDPRLALVMLEVPANSQAFSQTKFDIARELLKPDA